MSSKVNAACKTVVAKTDKNIVESKQHLVIYNSTFLASNEFIVI